MVAKIPPPPMLTTPELQKLNRWLLEIQNILNSGGLIEPSQVDGLPALFSQVVINVTQIAALQVEDANLQAQITQNAADIVTLQGLVAVLQGQVTTLLVRNQVLNGGGSPSGLLGNNGDLYLNNGGGVGSFLYGKISGTWQVLA